MKYSDIDENPQNTRKETVHIYTGMGKIFVGGRFVFESAYELEQYLEITTEYGALFGNEIKWGPFAIGKLKASTRELADIGDALAQLRMCDGQCFMFHVTDLEKGEVKGFRGPYDNSEMVLSTKLSD